MTGWTTAVYLVCAIALCAIGAVRFFAGGHPVRRLLSLNVTASGVFLYLVATGYRSGGVAPDPVPQAMVLTGLVVSVAATAVALVLIGPPNRNRRGAGSTSG